jgi:hypothetical protein
VIARHEQALDAHFGRRFDAALGRLADSADVAREK